MASHTPTTSDPRGRNQGGFTLIEITVATLLLLGGVTAVLQIFSVGVSTRRSADAVERSAHLANEVVQRIVRDVLRQVPEDEPFPTPENISETPVPGVPGMRYRVEFTTDPETIDLMLAEIRVAWRQEGAEEEMVFRRILKRHRPFAVRVQEAREQRRQ